jgi:hypothetical protein
VPYAEIISRTVIRAVQTCAQRVSVTFDADHTWCLSQDSTLPLAGCGVLPGVAVLISGLLPAAPVTTATPRLLLKLAAAKVLLIVAVPEVVKVIAPRAVPEPTAPLKVVPPEPLLTARL